MKRLSLVVAVLALFASGVGAGQWTPKNVAGTAQGITVQAGDTLQSDGLTTLDTAVVTGPATFDTLTSTSVAILDTVRADSMRVTKLTVLTSSSLPAGARETVSWIDPDTIQSFTVYSGQTLTAAAGDIDTLSGGTKITGSATMSTGTTLTADILTTSGKTTLGDAAADTTITTGKQWIGGNLRQGSTTTAADSGGSFVSLSTTGGAKLAGTLNVTGVSTMTGRLTVIPSAVASGVAAPSDVVARLEKNGDASLEIVTPAANSGTIRFEDTGADRGWISYNHATDGLAFGVNGAQQWHILSTGDLTPQTDNGPNIGSVAATVDTVFAQALNSSGNSYIMATIAANTKATGPALTINQGGSDDEILSLKSSDVAHGITDATETNTFGRLVKQSATDGGVEIDGYGEGKFGVVLGGLMTAKDSVATTAAIGAVYLWAGIKAGTTTAALDANGNILTVNSGGTAKFIVQGNGNFYYDGTGAAYDTYDDAELLRAYGKALAPHDTAFAAPGLLRYTEDDVVRSGVLSARRSEGGMTNGPALARLQAGAAHQAANGLEFYGRIRSDINDKANMRAVDTFAVVQAFSKISPPQRYTYKPQVFTDPAQIERAKSDTSQGVLERKVAEAVSALVKARTIEVIDRLDTTWSEQAVPTDSIVESYKVALDSLGVATDAEPVYTYTKYDTVRAIAEIDTIHKSIPGTVSKGEQATIQDSVLTAQTAKVAGSLANYQRWIDVQASEQHVSLMAQEVAPAIAALTGAPADTTKYDLRDLVHTQQVVIQQQGTRIATLEQRLAALEARVAKVERR